MRSQKTFNPFSILVALAFLVGALFAPLAYGVDETGGMAPHESQQSMHGYEWEADDDEEEDDDDDDENEEDGWSGQDW